MVQNLAFLPESGNVWSYKSDRRGYHYDWETALKIAPVGWHLPTKAEWASVSNEFEKYGWIYFDQDTPVRITDFYTRNGYCNSKGTNFSDGSSYYWSATGSSPGEAVGFCFPCWYDCASGGNSFSKSFDRSLGLSVILFKDL
jgi:uncharacterized protein (TIGR02145 family)